MRRYLHPLALLLALGAAIRLLAMLGYRPAWGIYSDTQQYAASAADLSSTFASQFPIRPAGYPVFLEALHQVSESMTLVVAVQHVLGLATATLLYLIMRRVRTPRWLALAAAATVALIPDLVLFEHALLTEALFLFLITAALFAAVCGIDDALGGAARRRWVCWLVGAGALFAIAAMTRAVGEVIVLPVAIVAAVAVGGRLPRRVAAGAAIAVPAAALILAYSIAMSAAGGYFGLANGAGWALYTRVAPIADCTQFTPPEGTKGLCERTDPESRPGPDFYAWHPESRARALFVGPPRHDDVVGSFGRAALLNQPLAYLEIVLIDLWRYVDFDAGPARPSNGSPISDYRFAGETSEMYTDDSLASYYGDYRYVITDVGRTLGDVQQVLRIHGPVMLLALLLGIAGLAIGPARLRVGIVLLGGVSFLLLLAPVAIGVYNSRYVVVAGPGLVSAGLLGAWALTERFGHSLRPRAVQILGWWGSRWGAKHRPSSIRDGPG